MNEQVTDISQAFKRLTSEMASMREVMDAMHTENVNLRRTVEKLRAENRTLRKQLEKYEGPKKNSNNSSTPPSKEPMKDEVLRRTKSLPRKSGLKPGGQPGHEGHLKKLVAVPDA
ncbi:DUF6444 domain-containing protein, partial [Prevotella melaninogenica]